MSADIWSYRTEDLAPTQDLQGFDVQTTDGSIGHIDESTNEVDRSYIVVDTGFWIFGKKRLVPASAITEIDLDNEVVILSLTKDQVKEAPDYDELRTPEPEYWDDMAGYYGRYPIM